MFAAEDGVGIIYRRAKHGDNVDAQHHGIKDEQRHAPHKLGPLNGPLRNILWIQLPFSNHKTVTAFVPLPLQFSMKLGRCILFRRCTHTDLGLHSADNVAVATE